MPPILPPLARRTQAIVNGYSDVDLEQFFDRVDHDLLIARLSRRVTDRGVLRLVRAYLNSGTLIDGIVVASEQGTPQGGPLSPLLANVFLDEVDKELERRGHCFVRYVGLIHGVLTVAWSDRLGLPRLC